MINEPVTTISLAGSSSAAASWANEGVEINDATVGLAPNDLVRALTFWRHPPLIKSIPILESV